MLAIPIVKKSDAAALRSIKFALEKADLIEARMDLIGARDEAAFLEKAIAVCVKKRGRMVFTYRAREGESRLQKERRQKAMENAVKNNVAFLDVDMADGKDAIGALRRLIIKHDGRVKMIVSHHDFIKTPSEKRLREISASCVNLGADIVKIVTTARSHEDNLKILNLIEHAKKRGQRIIAFCMGDLGRVSRIAAPIFGSMIGYAALSDAERSAKGQLTIEESAMLEKIIAPSGKSSTMPAPNEAPASNLFARGGGDVFALFGNPIAHSLSPRMHNAAFSAMKIDGVYVPFCVRDIKIAVASIKAMGIKGVSVTMPFKSDVLPLLDEVDDDAQTIGAVNTIVNTDGKLCGHNTDWLGAMGALQARLRLKGKRVAILGAGGTARAICFGALKCGATPVIINRNVERGEALKKDFAVEFYHLRDLRDVHAEILINTTPVGVAPDVDALPIPAEFLKNFAVMMDVIYNPWETRLLKEAKKMGVKVIPGAEMFVRQGAEQLKLWTGKNAPLSLMRDIVRASLITSHDGPITKTGARKVK